MTANPLARRNEQADYQVYDKQARCNELNEKNLTHMMDQFYFVRTFKDNTQKIECIHLPVGTKRWIKENENRVKGLIRKMTDGDQSLIDEIYERAWRAARNPVAWSNRRVV